MSYTFTSHSSVFRVVTVVISNGIVTAFQQTVLCTITVHIVKVYETKPFAKIAFLNWNRSWRKRYQLT